ncbi:MAG: hypothetical protein QOJ79_2276 [Actinomycetota bacterium]|jgi:hypothetical protein|nr:hypothetical protein [Actinomycetota bacterium]
MRWEALFGDLEAQAEALAAAELHAEVADRTRREQGLLRLVDRLREAEGHPLAVTVAGAGVVHGRLLDAGTDWLLLAETGARELLVPLASVLGVTGIGVRTAVPGSEGEVGRRLDLRWALRGLARDRAGVAVVLRDGSTVSGTLDRVGADHVDLAEHPPGEARRAVAVRQVRVVPLDAIALLRSS